MVRVRYVFSSRRTRHIGNMRKQKSKVPDLIKNLIKISDVVLEVLDARFLQETRNKDVEMLIKNYNKKIIYVINKADLVNITEIREQAELSGIKPYVFVSCKNRRGAKNLRKMIRIEVSKMPKRYYRAQVGVVGYPNTGKSSLINFLTGRGAAKVAPEAGFTKGVHKIRLTSNILLLDSPGVIPIKETDVKRKDFINKHAKIGVKTWDKIKEPEFIVLNLFKQFSREIEKFYEFKQADYEDFDDFIEKLGRKKNILKKGGHIDTDKVARLILKDWQEGRIKT